MLKVILTDLEPGKYYVHLIQGLLIQCESKRDCSELLDTQLRNDLMDLSIDMDGDIVRVTDIDTKLYSQKCLTRLYD